MPAGEEESLHVRTVEVAPSESSLSIPLALHILARWLVRERQGESSQGIEKNTNPAESMSSAEYGESPCP